MKCPKCGNTNIRELSEPNIWEQVMCLNCLHRGTWKDFGLKNEGLVEMPAGASLDVTVYLGKTAPATDQETVRLKFVSGTIPRTEAVTVTAHELNGQVVCNLWRCQLGFWFKLSPEQVEEMPLNAVHLGGHLLRFAMSPTGQSMIRQHDAWKDVIRNLNDQVRSLAHARHEDEDQEPSA